MRSGGLFLFIGSPFMESVSTSTALDALIDEYFEKINALGSVTVIETGRLKYGQCLVFGCNYLHCFRCCLLYLRTGVIQMADVEKAFDDQDQGEIDPRDKARRSQILASISSGAISTEQQRSRIVVLTTTKANTT
jgi:hypothetical protein